LAMRLPCWEALTETAKRNIWMCQQDDASWVR
jgi:hypothetical protein